LSNFPINRIAELTPSAWLVRNQPPKSGDRSTDGVAQTDAIDEAVRAFKKHYLEVVHRIIDHLKTEDAG
jgi:hypothetical protein